MPLCSTRRMRPCMKVFVFDLLPYGENFEHLREGKELPYPLSKKDIKPDVAVRTYAEHLDAWQLLDELGYDGVGFNEHHTSPYGLMNSPNLMAAAAAQRTKNIKLLIYGNLLPLHEPLRPARVQCAQREARRIARTLRRSVRHHHEGVDGRRVLVRGQVLVVSRRRDLAAPGAAARAAGVDADNEQQ